MPDILEIISNSVDLRDHLYQKFIEIDLTEDGYSADIFLYYEAGTVLEGEGRRFFITLPSGLELTFVQKSVPKVDKEVYDDPSSPDKAMYVYKCHCVDPITFQENQPPPDICPKVNTTTGAIFRLLLGEYDPTLDVEGIQAGNSIDSFNFKEFSSFGDIRRSEIVSGGYSLRMGNGLSVQGNFDTEFEDGDYRVDYTDFRYTPRDQDIEPPDEILGSVTVIPAKEIPTHVTYEIHEQDLRAMPALSLAEKPFGLEESEPLKLGAGIDLGDTDLYETTGIITTGSFLIFSSGNLILRESRPYKFPFITTFSGILLSAEDAEFEFGFANGCEGGSVLIAVTSSDFSGAGIPLAVDTEFDQHRYAAYFMPKADGSIAVWGLYKRQNFNVDEDAIIGQIIDIDAVNITITLNNPWTAGTDFIRVLHEGTEVDRATILHRDETGTILRLDHIPVGAVEGDDVTLGVQEETTTMIRLLKTVSAGAGYGLPYLTGTGVALQAMTIQRIPQITGKLIFQTQTNPDSDYPRDLFLNTDITEFTDGVVSGSGSGASITWDTKFSSEPQAWFTVGYTVGGKGKFTSTCGTGAHAVVPIEQEQDPERLQMIADMICALGSKPYPRVTGKIHGSLVDGTPLPGDMLPVHLTAEYNIPDQSVPITSIKISHRGASIDINELNQDESFYDIQAGPKSPVDRVKQLLLRTTNLTKYPVRVVTLSGVVIEDWNWNDETGILTASITGGTVYGPRNEVLDFASGIRPGDVAGVRDPAASPVVFLCKVPTARGVADQIVVQVIYRPNGIDPVTASFKWFNKERRIEFKWRFASGAKKYNIFKRKEGHTGDLDEDLELVDTVVAPGVSWSGAIDKGDINERTIWVQSVGLCDKTSSKIKLIARLDPLPAPEVFSVVKKMNHRGRVVILVSAPPQDADLGRAMSARFFMRRSTTTLYTEREDFAYNQVDTKIVDVPVVSENEAARYHIRFEDFQEGDIVSCGFAWIDQFSDEGAFLEPIDINHPPFVVGSVATETFFRSPNPAHPETNQAAGGTYLDDDDTTTKIEETGLHRVLVGQHTDAIRLVYERSTKTRDATVGDWPSDGSRKIHSRKVELADVDIVNGFVDVLMYRSFNWAKKKHFTYRLAQVIFFGVVKREVEGDGGAINFVNAKRYLLGFDGDPTGQPIVAYDTDGYFNKTEFEFKPWFSGIDHSYYKIQDVRAKQKPKKIKERWEPIDDSNLRRYIVLISETNFGTKGPGTDSDMVTDLDLILAPVSDGGGGGVGAITLWNQANTTKNVDAIVIECGTNPAFDWETGDTYGTITIDQDKTYFVGVLAQNKAGRYSDELSDTDSEFPGDDPNDNGGEETQDPDEPIGGIIDAAFDALTDLCYKNNTVYITDRGTIGVGGGDSDSKIHIIDVSDKTDPQIITSWTIDSSTAYEPSNIHRKGKYLYVVGNGQLLVVDIHDPANPELIAQIAINSPAPTYASFARGSYLYVTSPYGGCHLLTVKISDPYNPVFMSDLAYGSGFSPPQLNQGIYVQGDRVYALSYKSTAPDNANAKLSIIDVSDKSSPVELSSTRLDFGAGTPTLNSPTDLWVVVNDEDGSKTAYIQANNVVIVFDVKHGDDPQLLGTLVFTDAFAGGSTAVQTVKRRTYVARARGGGGGNHCGFTTFKTNDPDALEKIHETSIYGLGSADGSKGDIKTLVARSKWIFVLSTKGLTIFKKGGSTSDGGDGDPEGSGSEGGDTGGDEFVPTGGDTGGGGFVSGDQIITGDLYIGAERAVGAITHIFVSTASDKPGLRWNGPSLQWEFSNDGTTWTAFGSGGSFITGSGTTGKVPKFTSSTAIGDSNISDNGSAVSIGLDTVITGVIVVSGNAAIGGATAISGSNSISILVSSASTKPGLRYLSTGTGTGKWQFSQDGSAWIDFLTSAGITGVQVSLNGSLVGTRAAINLIEGTDIDLVITDNSGASRVDVTVNSTASGGGGGSLTIQQAMALIRRMR